MLRELVISVRAVVVTMLFAGVAYPALVTLGAVLVAPRQASGSLARDNRGVVVGSELIGQPFTRPGYFWPRPSAAGAGHDPLSSSGSNLGPTSRRLRQRVSAEVERLRTTTSATGAVPDDLVTASGSGLDPHLSPAGALFQVERVARARGVAVERVRALLESRVEGRDLGLLGEPRVNVLLLNLALDHQFGTLSPPEPAHP